MNSKLEFIDYVIFIVYFVIVSSYGIWIYNKKKKATTDTKDFFLAEGSLTWWAIGASLIASNISAEQFIGMSGSGFKMGLAISTYELMAAATLVIVAVFFIPVYLKNKIYTMPQFLHQRYNGTVAMIMAISTYELMAAATLVIVAVFFIPVYLKNKIYTMPQFLHQRYNGTVAMIMAVFWLLLYVVVNLTSILYLGALAIHSISGLNTTLCMYVLAIFAIFITLGGMKVIGYTDVIQVFFLILGGLVTTYLALNLVSEKFGTTGTINGFNLMTEHANDHFHMIFDKSNPNYMDLPGLTLLVGGMWIVNLNYWGCNQYITQRALGADLPTARSGILFAAFLKLLMPVIVVIPGIAAYVLYNKGFFQEEMSQNGEVNPD